MTDFSICEKYRALIKDAEDFIWQNPETGYREIKTNSYLKEKLIGLGYSVYEPEGITGFYTVIDTKKEGPTVLLLAELDSVICPSHPDADKKTGAVHSCGHHIQCAALLGLAAVLKEDGVLDGLCGKIMLCFVPAEEGIELDFRNELIKSGVISYTSGKEEFLSRGIFDGVDLALLVHTNVKTDENVLFTLDISHDGNIKKRTEFIGKSCHAADPSEGINALNMASTALVTLNSLRETFLEKDLVRVHSIISHGGDAVNVIPDRVSLQTYVRGSSTKAIIETNKKVNRVLASTAAAFGGNVRIEDDFGYEPLFDSNEMNKTAFKVITDIFGEGKCNYYEMNPGSTDLGALSSLIPAIQTYSNCAIGTGHGADYYITDDETAGVSTVKYQLGMLTALLENNGERAKEITDSYIPVYKSKEEYFAFHKKCKVGKELVKYLQNGSIVLDLEE